jgi:glycosyltransferase involved in cell wall biosynthesis
MGNVSSNYEIIFVDDCSTDRSWDVIKSIHNENDNIVAIRLAKNAGQHSATICGFSNSKGYYVITLDDDLQHPPEEILKLINKMKDDYDVVMGKYEEKMHSRLRNIVSGINIKLIGITFNAPSDLSITSFRILRSQLIKNILDINTPYPHIPSLIFKCTPTDKIANVLVHHDKRAVGKSGYNFIKLFIIWSNLLINYSSIPLMIIGVFGFIMSILSLGLGFLILIRRILNPEYGVMGWNSLIISLYLLSGSILMAIAIMGEYVRRIINQISYNRPYLIRDLLETKQQKDVWE